MVNLGDEVRDTLSGFRGIAIARHIYLHGCERISIQPPVDKEGKLPETACFDEPQLEVIREKKQTRKVPKKKTGGPEKYSDAGREIPSR